MKKLIFAFFLLPLFLQAQDIIPNPTVSIDTEKKEIVYKETVDMPGYSKEEIYSTLREWVPKDFYVAQSYISYEDFKAGKIIAHAMVFGHRQVGLFSPPYSISFNIYLWVKDAKYKYEIADFFVIWGLNGDASPDMHSADVYITDPQFKNKKGEYTGRARLILYNIDGNAKNTIVNLKYAVKTKKYSHKIDEDF
ncbi:DUF4468 domain-containing protein [Mucilaginibacter sp.]|uniref:DUF4468 domain-containing protein n=1 Tax=Mucilaginibacter sp. TaxID=1882438 RepID=UPI0025FD972C|nr:DUF4468 domain-containing protein [Mucilaginibacter sp.]